MELSEKQIEADRIWTEEDCNLLVDSVAGSGKTTLILNLAKKCPGKTLMLAFNKSIQLELEDRTRSEGHLKTMTLHGLGLMAIKTHIGYHIKVNKSKNYVIAKKLRELIPSYFKSLTWKKQVELNAYLINLNDVGRMFVTEDLDKIKTYMRDMGKPTCVVPNRRVIPRTKEEIEECQKDDKILVVDNDSYKITEKVIWDLFIQMRNTISTEIDFLDMIYIPVVMDLDIPLKPEYLTVDEAQDLNYCQHKLIDKIISQPQFKKWLSVGDFRQSIYGFSGALSNSFEMFREKNNVKETDLDICYRCSTNIINEANSVYPVMRGFKDSEGIVAVHEGIEDVVFEPNSMVICRNQAPLLELFFYLASIDVSCYLKGEDFMSGIISYLKPFKNKRYNDFYDELYDEVQKLKNKTSEQERIKYYILGEKLNILQLIKSNLNVGFKYIKEVLPMLEVLFKVRANAVTLCTIHKSKGLECNTVYWLHPELIPSKFATSPDQLKQEKNLKYVAITRAIEKLIIIKKKENGRNI